MERRAHFGLLHPPAIAPAGSASGSVGSLRWVAASLCLVCLHGVASLLRPQWAWITAASLLAQLVLSATFCLRLRDLFPKSMNRKLALAALAFLLWAAVYASVLWVEYVVRKDPPGAFAGDLFAGLRALPFLLALCWPASERTQPEEWIDVLQAVLLCVLLYVFLFPGLSTAPRAPVPPIDLFLSTVFVDLNNVLLLAVAILCTLSSETEHTLRLHRALALLFLAFVATSAFANHIVIQRWQVPPGSPWFLLADLPIVLFLLSFNARMRPGRTARTFLFRAGIRRYVQFCIPIVYSLAGFLFSVALSLKLNHPYLGIVLGTLNLFLYAARTARAQMRYEAAHHSLKEANSALQELSGRDALTGVYNRRWFSQSMEQFWQDGQDSAFPLSLLLLDVDFFKGYNDRHGHIRGDECLIAVAELITAQLRRSNDILARYGGEEFAVILPQTDAEGARHVAEQLCRSVQAAQIPHPSSPFGAVTVSVGVSTYKSGVPHHLLPGTHPSEMMILLADAALYEAKRTGRNRVNCIHTT